MPGLGTGVLIDERYTDHIMPYGHPERVERIRRLLDHGALFELDGVTRRSAGRKATRDELLLVHSPGHIDRIAATSGREYAMLDPDTHASPLSYQTALLAAGGVLDLIDAVWRGEVANGIALVRPPGHHAERDRGMGFCLFNNIAIGARYLMEAHGARRILVVDWDVHHGNGTQWAFYDDSRVLFMSIHQYPFYPGTGAASDAGQGSGSGFTVNVPMRAGYGDAECLDAFELVFRPIAQRYAPEFVLVSAGFDAHHADPLGGLQVTEQGFADMASVVLDVARTSASGRCVLVLEGGYHLEALALSVESVVRRLCSAGSDKAEKSESRPYRRLSRIDFLSPILQVHSGFWGLSRAAD